MTDDHRSVRTRRSRVVRSAHTTMAKYGFQGVFVLAAVTFAAAYYVPLYRTHKALVADYASLAERVTTVEKDLVRTRADLTAASATNQELLARHRADDGNRSQPSSALAHLQTELASKLASQIDKRELSVAVHADRLNVTLPAATKQIQNRAEVTAAGQSALCGIATTLTGSPFAVTIAAEMPETKAGAGVSTARDLATARAAAAARVMEQKCAYPGDHIATLTRPTSGASSAGAGTGIDVEVASMER